MRVGMAVNSPKTEEDRKHIAEIIKHLDDAILHARHVELWIAGDPATEFLGAVSEQLMNLLRRTA